MNYFIKTAVEILYPPRCPICHDIVKRPGEMVCADCLRKLHRIREPRCLKCGKQIESSRKEFCEDCAGKVHGFDQGISVFLYDETMRRSVAAFKFHNKREYAVFYGREMAAVLTLFLKKWNPQACIPVPIHKKKKKMRGFNQAELLASEISRICKIPMLPELLERVKATSPQKELDRRERKNNLKNAFKIKKYDVELDRVLLVDDIYTTGSTMDEISQVLRRNGVKKIYFIVLCSGMI